MWLVGLFCMLSVVQFTHTLSPAQAIDPNPMEENTGPEYGFDLPLPDQRSLWLARPRPADSSDFYNFTYFTLGLNELTPTLKSARFERSLQGNTALPEPSASLENRMMLSSITASVTSSPFLPPTDCRFRPDIRALELGNMGMYIQIVYLMQSLTPVVLFFSRFYFFFVMSYFRCRCRRKEPPGRETTSCSQIARHTAT